MSWREVMERVLPPIEGVKPHVTSPFLSIGRPKKSSNPHTGADFNYIGGQSVPLNRSYQTVHSPVDGVVENAGTGTVGRISIRDGNGYRHEILHTHSQRVAVGDPVVAGQPIGTMGNMGGKKASVESGDHHVHYQLLDPSTGFRLSPSGFADDQDPSLRASREAYWRYLQSKDANTEQVGNEESGPARPPDAKAETRYLGRRIAGQPDPIAPGAPASFDGRFGNWNSSGGASAPFGRGQLVPPEQGRPRGIFSDDPLPAYALPPSIWGFPNPSETSGAESWSLARRGPADWNGDRRRR